MMKNRESFGRVSTEGRRKAVKISGSRFSGQSQPRFFRAETLDAMLFAAVAPFARQVQGYVGDEQGENRGQSRRAGEALEPLDDHLCI